MSHDGATRMRWRRSIVLLAMAAMATTLATLGGGLMASPSEPVDAAVHTGLGGLGSGAWIYYRCLDPRVWEFHRIGGFWQGAALACAAAGMAITSLAYAVSMWRMWRAWHPLGSNTCAVPKLATTATTITATVYTPYVCQSPIMLGVPLDDPGSLVVVIQHP